jgi:hypothetical protein
LEVVRYLKEGFGLTKEDAQADGNYALCQSAQRGHLDVVKYLVEAFGLGKEDPESPSNGAIIFCISGGHLEILRYLMEACGVGKKDVRQICTDYLWTQNKITEKQLQVGRYLEEELGLCNPFVPRRVVLFEALKAGLCK